MGDSVVKISLASLVGLLTIAVYLVLVPLMVFFLLKDKEQMLNAVRRVLRVTVGWQDRCGRR
ncbi:putative permease [Escherichia coli]|uniref:Putative permease n=1 Tax=Escherichia coli TaxID=562 RepID=A0A376TUC3_ECOLX|nr:putative permease [Escherichia coli]